MIPRGLRAHLELEALLDTPPLAFYIACGLAQLRIQADALLDGTTGNPAPVARWLRILAQELDGKSVLAEAR